MLDDVRTAALRVEGAATDALAALGPWLAPIPSAVLVARASQEHLQWSPALGLVAGAIIEILGLTATSTALTLWDYNESKRKSDPSAPFALAAVLIGCYFVATVGLTVLLDIAPALARYAPALFPALALVGTVNLALRAQHKRRMAALAQEKTERRTQRAQRSAQGRAQQGAQKSAQVVHRSDAHHPPGDDRPNAPLAAQFDALGVANRSKRAYKAARLDALLEVYRGNPEMGVAEAGRLIGVHRNTVYNYNAALEAAGRVQRNGNGWDVVGDPP